MTLEDKKLFIEWMGWKILINSIHGTFLYKKRKISGWLDPIGLNIDSLHCPDSLWQKIYRRMTIEEKNMYMHKIGRLSKIKKGVVHVAWTSFWNYHTTTVEIRAKALIEIIKHKKRTQE